MVAAARLASIHTHIIGVLDRYISPLFDLAVRLWIAQVFFRSGRTKLADWAITISLFRDEYNVLLLPPGAAAVFGTAFELGMPIFLVLGLASRLAALPLIVMTCVIQFGLGGTNPDYDSVEHFYWLFLLGMIVIKGPGLISLDHPIRARFARP